MNKEEVFKAIDDVLSHYTEQFMSLEDRNSISRVLSKFALSIVEKCVPEEQHVPLVGSQGFEVGFNLARSETLKNAHSLLSEGEKKSEP